MSHVTAGLTEVSDLAVLKSVALAMGFTWKDQKTYRFYGEFLDDWGNANEHLTARARGIDPSEYGKCDACLSLPGCGYDIGITKNKDGETWRLVWDTWSSHGLMLSSKVGDNAEKIMTEYNREVCRRHAEVQGMTYMEETNQDGDIVVTMTQY